jgi:hypothetical protein
MEKKIVIKDDSSKIVAVLSDKGIDTLYVNSVK